VKLWTDFLRELGWPAAQARSQAQKMAAYVDLILRYGARLNLVGQLDRGFLERELVLGSLQLLRWRIPRGRLVDVGSGAGIPGIPLAIVLPELEVTLVESRGKRAAFLARVIRELGLGRVVVEARNVQSLCPADFDWAVARAFRPPQDWLAVAVQLVRPGGQVAVYSTREAWSQVRLPPGLSLEVVMEDATVEGRVVVGLGWRLEA
jgi:16S rRNA (guanine527-N7)-methyltransferase